MQALMLAAGMGKRLAKFTQDNTKCMVEVNGKKLIEKTIEILKQNGINKLVIVVGFKKEKLKKYVKDNIRGIEVVFIDNEEYATSNNIYSLYLAKEYLERDDTLLLESDLIYEESLIKTILTNENKNLAAVAKYEKWMDGTVVEIDNDNNIKAFIEKKDLQVDKENEYYKTINIYKLSKEFSQKEFLPFLKTFMDVYGKNEYYELTFKILANLGRTDLKAQIIEGINWYEIDNEQDLNIANQLFK